MFFEDEKENIGNNSDMQFEDNETSWDGILDDSDDDLISIKESSAQAQGFVDDSDEIPGLSSFGLDDELKLIDDDVISSDGEIDDVSDDELARILNEESPKEKAFDAFGTGSDESGDEAINEEDFNFDDELQGIGSSEQYEETPVDDNAGYEEIPQAQAYQQQANNADEDDEIIYQPQQAQKQKQGTSPVLLAVCFATLVAAGIYWYLNQSKEDAVGPIQPVSNYAQEENQNMAENPQESIPVVNEEEVDTIKPDIPEKTEVVSVQSTGKVNPFVPLQKYMAYNSEVVETRYNYDAVGIAKPPADYGEIDEVATKLMTISVSGIMYDEVKPSAIITFEENDYFVQKGDRLDDYRVIDITRNNVKIALGNNVYKANLGEEFKIDTFYGNAKYLPSKQGGGKQYYSVSEEESNGTSRRSGRYTSESDVSVNSRRR